MNKIFNAFKRAAGPSKKKDWVTDRGVTKIFDKYFPGYIEGDISKQEQTPEGFKFILTTAIMGNDMPSKEFRNGVKELAKYMGASVKRITDEDGQHAFELTAPGWYSSGKI